MIRIHYNWLDMELEVTGHAGKMDEKGWDPVCAAVSLVVQALVYQAIIHCKDEKTTFAKLQASTLVEKEEHRLENGDCYIRIWPTDMGEGPMRNRFMATLESLQMLQKTYPDAFDTSTLI